MRHAQYCLNTTDDLEADLLAIGDKVECLENGKLCKLFLPTFVEFQYPKLKPTTNLHRQVIDLLLDHNVFDRVRGSAAFLDTCRRARLELEQPSRRAVGIGIGIGKGKGKGKGKVEGECKGGVDLFSQAREIYLGTKRGNATEFANFKKKHKDWQAVLPLLKPAIERQVEWHKSNKCFWKNFSTWINQRCWEDELSENNYDTNGQTTQAGHNQRTEGDGREARRDKNARRGFEELPYAGKDDDLTYHGK